METQNKYERKHPEREEALFEKADYTFADELEAYQVSRKKDRNKKLVRWGAGLALIVVGAMSHLGSFNKARDIEKSLPNDIPANVESAYEVEKQVESLRRDPHVTFTTSDYFGARGSEMKKVYFESTLKQHRENLQDGYLQRSIIDWEEYSGNEGSRAAKCYFGGLATSATLTAAGTLLLTKKKKQGNSNGQ